MFGLPLPASSAMTFGGVAAPQPSGKLGSLALPVGLASFPVVQNAGRMQMVGVKKDGSDNITYSGFKVSDVLYSMIRYIQMGDQTKATVCATEVFRLGEIQAVDSVRLLYIALLESASMDVSPKEQAIQCTLINRIVAYKDLYKGKDRISPTMGEIVYIVEVLCKAKKSKIAREISELYFTVNGYAVALQAGLPHHTKEPSAGDVNDAARQNVSTIFQQHGVAPSGPLFNIAVDFCRRLINKSLTALYMWRVFEEQGKRHKFTVKALPGSAAKRTNPNQIIFDIIRLFNGNNRNLVGPYEEAFYKAGVVREKQFIINMVLDAMLGISTPGLPSNVDIQKIGQVNSSPTITSLRTGNYSQLLTGGQLNLSDVLMAHSPSTENYNIRTPDADIDLKIEQIDNAYKLLSSPGVSASKGKQTGFFV
jgi:hypothetical protein